MQYASYDVISLWMYIRFIMVGANMIVEGALTTGQLVSLFSYIMNIMISLMMLSMVFVMVTMSKASAERIAEVLEEKSDLTNPENPDFEIENGDIDFNEC